MHGTDGSSNKSEGARRYEQFWAEQMADPHFRAVYEEESAKKDLWLQLVEARQQAGLTQQQMAERLGVSQAQVARIEKRGYDSYTLNTLRRYVQALGDGYSLKVKVESPAEDTETGAEVVGTTWRPLMTGRQLPVAIQYILPVLARDHGRGRATTLLAVLGAGPDAVEQLLESIHAALGSDSPGIAELTGLIRMARERSSAASPRIRRQHVISKAVLRQFCELVGTGQQHKLERYDLTHRTSKPIVADGAGYVPDFVKIDSETTEMIWKEVEDKLPAAISAAESGSVLSDPTLLKVLRDAIALHFVRNPRTRDIHEHAFGEIYKQSLDEISGTILSADAFRNTHGLEPAGSEAFRLGAEALFDRSKKLFDDGILFRLRVQALFETVSDRFQNKGLEVIVPASSHREFLIGDVPALPVNFTSGAAGVTKGVTLKDANTIILPLAPRVLVALGPTDAMGTAPDQLMDSLNRLQVGEAQQYVYHRPQAHFPDLAAWRDGTPLKDAGDAPADPLWEGYDPESALAAFRATAGSWSDVDADELIAKIYRWREEGSRPMGRP